MVRYLETKVGVLRDRLIAQIEDEIYNPNEFMFAVGHTLENGVAGDTLSVTHKPPGISRAEPCSHGALHRELLDEVLAELWRRENGETNL